MNFNYNTGKITFYHNTFLSYLPSYCVVKFCAFESAINSMALATCYITLTYLNTWHVKEKTWYVSCCCLSATLLGMYKIIQYTWPIGFLVTKLLKLEASIMIIVGSLHFRMDIELLLDSACTHWRNTQTIHFIWCNNTRFCFISSQVFYSLFISDSQWVIVTHD